MIQQDDYGFYEIKGIVREYILMDGETTQRKVSMAYPQTVRVLGSYRKYSALPEIAELLGAQAHLIEKHVESALNTNLPFSMRRMHYDMIGTYLKGEAYLLWKNGGGVSV